MRSLGRTADQTLWAIRSAQSFAWALSGSTSLTQIQVTHGGHPHDPRTGARPRGNPTEHRGPLDLGVRRTGGAPVGGIALVARTPQDDAMARDEPDDPPPQRCEQPHHLTLGRRRRECVASISGSTPGCAAPSTPGRGWRAVLHSAGAGTPLSVWQTAEPAGPTLGRPSALLCRACRTTQLLTTRPWPACA
jgi:hypothetical protein